MITDGEPTDMKKGDQKWIMVKETIADCEKNGKLLFFSVCVRNLPTWISSMILCLQAGD